MWIHWEYVKVKLEIYLLTYRFYIKKFVLKDKKYKISVFTGNKTNAGTDADVTIVIFGTLGDSGEYKLDDSKNNFERGR
jgi:hypothetical protein